MTFVTLHRDDARMGERDHVLGRVDRNAQAHGHALQRLGIRQLGRRARHEGEGVLEAARVVLVADHPVHGAAVVRPVQVGADIGRDPGDRNGRAFLAQLDDAAGLRHRRDVGVEQFGERDPLPVRAHRHEIRVLQREHVTRLLAVQADALQFLAEAAAAQESDATAVGRELRLVAILRDACRVTARGRHPPDALLAAVQRTGERRTALLRPDDLRTIARVTRRIVETRLARQHALAAAGEIAFDDGALLRIAPGRVQQLLAIGAEARLVLEGIAARGQALRQFIRQRTRPQLSDGMKHDREAIRAGGDIANHLRR
jgi:hypothetical protein